MNLPDAASSEIDIGINLTVSLSRETISGMTVKKQWEHVVTRDVLSDDDDGTKLQKALREMEDDGWEFVAVVPVTRQRPANSTAPLSHDFGDNKFYVFKRPARPEQPTKRISQGKMPECDACGVRLVDSEPGRVLLSSPPQTRVHCPSCGWKGFRIL